MQQFTSTQAKQNFGQPLAIAAQEPVAIERHGRVQAILLAPTLLSDVHTSAEAEVLTQRRLARANQSLLEKDRLIRHQRIALTLATATAPARRKLIAQAQVVVERWRREHLCSADYVDRWAAILALPVPAMVDAMTTDGDPWAPALRQNSPWVGVHA